MCSLGARLISQGSAIEQALGRIDEDGLKQAVEQGLVYYQREERDLQMLLFPEVLDQVLPGRIRRGLTLDATAANSRRTRMIVEPSEGNERADGEVLDVIL